LGKPHQENLGIGVAMIFQSDLVLMSTIQLGLNDLRRNNFLLDEAFGSLVLDPYLAKMYGQKEIDRFQTFISKNIGLYVDHRPPDNGKFPCIVIKVGAGTEDTSREALGDSYQSELREPSYYKGAIATIPNILLGPVTPISYNMYTGLITFDPSVSLSKSNVFDTTCMIVDNINQKSYPIALVMSDNSLQIATGIQNINLTGMTITPVNQQLANTIRSLWMYENHTISMYASEATEVIYLFNIVFYILQRHKLHLLDRRNFAVSTMGYSEIYRASSPDDPNNLYGRDITLRGRVEQAVIESTTPLLLGIIPTIELDGIPQPDTIDPRNQIWFGQVESNGDIYNPLVDKNGAPISEEESGD
jgi:hypothetical protein